MIYLLIILLTLILALKIGTFIFIKTSKSQKTNFYFPYLISNLEDIHKLSGFEFERFCKWLLTNNKKFIDVELTPLVNDGGVDIILTKTNLEKIYVECKRYGNSFKIDTHLCKKLVGAMAIDNIYEGIILTTGSISPEALNYAKNLNRNSKFQISFWDGEQIRTLFNEKKEFYTIDYTL